MKTDQLRIGDAERDAAIAALSRHYADGRLTAQEHEERVELAMKARTGAELGALLADLPRFEDSPGRRRPGVRPYRLVPLAVLAIVATGIVFHALPLVVLFPLAFIIVRSGFGRHWRPGCEARFGRHLPASRP